MVCKQLEHWPLKKGYMWINKHTHICVSQIKWAHIVTGSNNTLKCITVNVYRVWATLENRIHQQNVYSNLCIKNLHFLDDHTKKQHIVIVKAHDLWHVYIAVQVNQYQRIKSYEIYAMNIMAQSLPYAYGVPDSLWVSSILAAELQSTCSFYHT